MLEIENKKIAFIATVYRHLESFHLPFMNALINQGFEVHAFAYPNQGKKSLDNLGVTCHDIPFSRNPFSIKNLKALRMLVDLFKQEKFQAIHVHTPVAALIGRVAAKITRVPIVIYTAHGFHFYSGAPLLNWLLYYPLEYFMARWTDYLITINNEDYERARKFPVKEETFLVHGVGVDLDLFQPEGKVNPDINFRKKLNLTENDFVILCAAELTANKNHIQLLKSIKMLNDRGKPAHCLIAGSGPEEERLKKLVRELDIVENVYFLGFRSDVIELMNASDIVVLFSRREGLPKVLMEAMGAGKAIVASDIRGNQDLISDGENGFLVPLNNVDATVTAIVKLYSDPELRMMMGENNLINVRPYDMNFILKEMLNIYESIFMR